MIHRRTGATRGVRLERARHPAVPAPAPVLAGVVGLEGGAVVTTTLIPSEPAVGALFGLIALGQRISLPQWAGMLAAGAASTGASVTASSGKAALDETELERVSSLGADRQLVSDFEFGGESPAALGREPVIAPYTDELTIARP